MKPESGNFSLPKILVEVLFEEIVIALRKTQVRLTELVAVVVVPLSNSICL